MSFLPIGPDFVFGPRDPDFMRMSRRNEIGRQLMVQQIAIDPSDPNTVYILSRPDSGGANVFRTDDGGASWTPLFDEIQQNAASLLDGRPGALAVDPVNTDTVYAAADTGSFFRSADRGAHWTGLSAIGGAFPVWLLVDPRTSATPSNAVILAATASGLFVSATGGASWSNVLPGQCVFIVASFAGSSGGDYYASFKDAGLFYATSPAGPWTDLTAKGIGLPAHGMGASVAFDQIAIALCRSNNRAYAWLERQGKTTGIFTSTSPSSAWQQVPAVGAPDPGQGTYSFGLSVAPNSPGDGANDILFFPGYRLARSIDAGRTWTTISTSYDAFHNDLHHVAFAPDPPPPGVIPATYTGCDGGLAVSTGYADPTVTLDGVPDFDSIDYVNNEALQDLNHGLHGIGVYTYACDPRYPSLGYLGSQDTAMAASHGALGWRGLDWGHDGQQEGDGFKAAVAPGSDAGMKVWFYLGVPNYIRLVTDTGTYVDNAEVDCTLGPGGPLMVATTNMVAGLDGQCLAGGWLRDDTGNKLTTAVTATGPQSVTPASMAGISKNVFLYIDSWPNQEYVQVTAVSGSSFTATFAKTHPVGAACQLQRFPIVRIDQQGNMAQISQDFGPLTQPQWIAIHPTDPNTLYVATLDQRVFITNSAAGASEATVWTEVTSGKPADLAGPKFIVGMSVDTAGHAFVLCSDLVHVPGSGEFTGFDTPLFTVSGGAWVGQRVAPSVPSSPQSSFGLIAADPSQPDTLYITRLSKVFAVVNGPQGWGWTDISDGLPGAPINDMWIGNIGGATPRVLLRVAATTRGIFERDVTAGATAPAIALYMRANLLDLAQLPTPPSSVLSPLDRVEVFHYQCVDIKVDARNSLGFFQTDPESPPPVSHVIFDQLRDNSENLPSTDMAQVHVQVHNRSAKPANNVQVWALFANASAGLPALPHDFVKNFLVTGKINGTVPADGPWQPIGPPQKLDNIAADSPQAATWSWNIPALSFASRVGHYCIAAFVHSAASPFTDTSNNVDDLAIRMRQVGQKNVHVGPPLDSSPFPSPTGRRFGAADAGSPGGAGRAGAAPPQVFRQMREYCEFHNPTTTTRHARILLDLRNLPPQLQVAFRLSRLNTVKPLAASITGAQPSGNASLGSKIRQVADRVADAIENAVEHYLDPIEDCFEKILDREEDHPSRPRRKTIPIDPTVYHAQSPGEVTIDGVVLGPNGAGAIDIVVRNAGILPPGSTYWFQAEQWVGGQIAGGSLYQVRIAGTRTRVPTPQLDLPPTVIPNYPLWAAPIIEADRARLGITGETS